MCLPGDGINPLVSNHQVIKGFYPIIVACDCTVYA